MEKINLFQKQLVEKIKFASEINRIRFALDICNRLIPDYEDFENKNQWGDCNILIESIEYINSLTNANNSDLDKLDLNIKKVESVIPDTENFSDWEVSFALNASIAVYELLTYIKDKEYGHILTISSLMTDNIDFKLQREDENISENDLKNHPLMINEIWRQLELLK